MNFLLYVQREGDQMKNSLKKPQAYIRKGFFLSTMCTPNSIVVCMYAFPFKKCIKNAFMPEQITIGIQSVIGIHDEEVPKLVYTLCWCNPVKQRRNLMYCQIFEINSIF